MNKVRLYWFLQVGGWTTYALAEITGHSVINERDITNTQIWFYVWEAVTFLILTHLYRILMIRAGWLSLNFRQLIPRSFMGIFAIAILAYVVRTIVAIPLGVYNKIAFSLLNFLGLTSVYILIAFVWTMAYLIYHYFERYNLSLKRQAVMHEIELNNLKSQLNPHFIFNSLNSIRALVDEDPRKSKNAITQLSLILRNTLVSDQNSLTNFDDELRTVKNYLGLESIRYEERLKITFTIDPECSRFQVPPLMLQTLVENGIKHGISQLKQGGEIMLKTFVENDKLHVQIRNSGRFKQLNGNKRKQGVGLGLINTKKRLELLYGDKASFKIENETNNLVLTELVLPKNTQLYESNNS
jgi:two-component system, LytTR family, sensor kinase